MDERAVESGDSGGEGLRPPRQARSRKTLDRIVRAALELVAEKGVDGASVHEIVDRAGSSVGSFYARFGGKDDLVRYVERRVWDDATARWDAGVAEGAWKDASLADLVEGLARLLVRIEQTDAEQRRAFGDGARSAAGHDAPAEAFRRHIAADVSGLLLERSDGVAHPDPVRAAEVLPRLLMGAIRELEPDPGDEASLRELVRMALGYLGAGAYDRERHPTTMDFFDVWA